MMNDNTNAVYTSEKMHAEYGSFYEKSSREAIDNTRVPPELQPIIPYAEFWGISDDCDRERLVLSAPRQVLDNLVAVVRAYDDVLDKWLAGPEAGSSSPTREYIAFSAMRMAADFA